MRRGHVTSPTYITLMEESDPAQGLGFNDDPPRFLDRADHSREPAGDAGRVAHAQGLQNAGYWEL